MYQNLINSLKKILDSKATQAEKLLKISTLVDFADGLETPIRPALPVQPTQTWYETGEKNPIGGGPKVTASQPTTPTVDAKHPNGPGALVGVEDIK